MVRGISGERHRYPKGRMRRLRGLLCLLTTCVLPLGAQPAGDPPFVDASIPSPIAASAVLEARLAAARSALAGGFPSIAEAGFVDVLARASGTLDASDVRDAALGLATARLALGDAAGARAALVSESDAGDPRMLLRLAWAAWLERAPPSLLRVEMDRLAAMELPSQDEPWRHLLVGLVAEELGDAARATAALRRARESSPDTAFAEEIDLQTARLRMRLGPPGREEADSLVARARSNFGEPLGFRTALLAAYGLAADGRGDAAITLLGEHLAHPGVDEDGAGDPLRILQAQLQGPESPQGIARLGEVLARPALPERQREALMILARSAVRSSPAAATFRAMLDDLIAREPSPVLLDAFLLQRARLRLDEGDLAGAGADAMTLVDRVPGSRLVVDAEWLQAYLAVASTPPRWRTAADLLGRIRDRLPPGAERARAARLVADCFFQEGDHLTAAEAYASLPGIGYLGTPGEVAYQQVLARVLAGQGRVAAEELDGLAARGGIDPEWRWRAEWNVLAGLRASGEVGAAQERLASLIEDPAGGIPPALELRLLWLQLDLGVATRSGQEGLGLSDRLIELLGRGVEGLPPEQVEALAAHVRLLRGRILLDGGDASAGLAALAELRRLHPRSEPAVLSFMIEARHHVLANRLDDAQRSLAALREAYPDSPFAARALYETALILEQRGLGTTWQEGVAILESLVQTYPTAPLVYDARLKQGDLLRRLGNFAAAQQVYEGLVTREPSHPSRWRAELGRADSMLAQAGQATDRLGAAAAAYERLAELPALPVDARIEASVKWASTLTRQRRTEQASSVYWLALERFLLSRSVGAEDVGATGRYWLARAAFELGEIRERLGQVSEAVAVYGLVVEARLPGASSAAARIARLRPPG